MADSKKKQKRGQEQGSQTPRQLSHKSVSTVKDSEKTPTESTEESTDKTSLVPESQTTLNLELQKAKEQEACLILIRGSPQGHRYFLTQNEMTMGRDPLADLSILDQGASRKHCQFTKEADGVVRMTDLQSSNGTFVNQRRLNSGESVILAKEDLIKLGTSIFKYLPKGELEILFYGNLGSAAYTDALTQAYNKGYLIEALQAEFKRAKTLHSELSLIFLDLDHFKKVNDTYGHDAGDYVLKEFSLLVRNHYVRSKDIFARYGGEEFVLLLLNQAGPEAMALAEKIRRAVESHRFIYEKKRLMVTISLGVAELTSTMESSQTLLKIADQALYSAKSSGRNQVVLA
jgi:diguanylate cyclase (GGDEF)-like protein